MSCNSSSSTPAKCEKSKRRWLWIDQRSGLLDMRAEHVAQRRMQQVRAGVMAHGRPPQLAIDHGIQPIAHHDAAAAP